MEESQFKVKKADLLRYIEGHKRAEEVIQAEKKKHLPQLTPEESLKIYDELCEFWETCGNKEGLEKLQERRITFLLEYRRRFIRSGVGKKIHESTI